MISQAQIDEMLQRIVTRGQQPDARSDEGLGMEELRALGAGMTEDAGEDFPAGTKVAFAEPDLEVAAPVRKPITPRAAPLPQAELPEKVVSVPTSAQAPDDLEAAYARAQDKAARRSMAFERGGRELVAGLTRTQAQPVTQRPVDAFDRYAQAQKEKRAGKAQGDQLELGKQKLDYDTKEAARKAAIDQERYEAGLKEKAIDNDRAERQLGVGKENAAATRALAAAGFGIKRDEHEAKVLDRDEKRSAGTIPFDDGMLTTTPGLTDTERGQARAKTSAWNAAFGAMDELDAAIAAFVANPSRETKAAVDAKTSTTSTALNAALGQGAMAEAEARRMADTLGGELFSPGGFEAAARSLMGEDPGTAGKLLRSKLKSARSVAKNSAVQSLRSYGDFAPGRGAPQTSAQPQRKIVKNPKTGERRYLNEDGSLGEAVP